MEMKKVTVEENGMTGEIELLNEGFDGEVKSKKSKNTNETRSNEKFFHPRNSFLTDHQATKYGRSIYNFFVTFALLQWTHLVTRSYLEGRGFDFGQHFIRKAFQNFHVALAIWVVIQCYVLSLYFGFKSWLVRRNSVNKRTIFNVSGATAFAIFYLLAMPVYSAIAVLSRSLGMAASFLIALEVIRFLMKMYAFVRSNVDKSWEAMPPFQCFLYFLFAPTLIYKDTYPRSPEIRWKFFAQCVAEVAGGVVLIAAILEIYVQPMFEDYGAEPVTWSDFVDRMFSCLMPALLIALTGFYCFFHSWMNGAAEILRFADRAFYSDWWTSTSFREFHRKLNSIVQDWIYFYLYRDLRSVFKRKFNCVLIIGVLTALAHEYILSLGTRMAVPICGWFFLVQPFLIQWTGSGRFMNFIICFVMTMCIMLSLSLYSMEISARQYRK